MGTKRAFVSGAIATSGMLILPLSVGIGSARVPARVETPYTLIDAESRTFIHHGFGGHEIDTQFEFKY